MISFNQLVKYILEDNAAGDGGVFGSGESFGHGGDVGNSDFWNRDDARIPFVLGTFRRNGRVKSKKRKRKHAKKRKR